ncbi:N-acetylglucosamine kinase [Oceanobacillus saliphilus]|uniref:N-acetylglucosamine kinase n=1 Tax=Oceanobacillus saliphilus TaxID=2925834 RepID=UPI00201E0296|nr:ROK family protein [Oceanobacillus saliphilus]
MTYVLGIDGGGTKTMVAVADSEGKIAASAKVGATNPNTLTVNELENTFQELFQNLEEQLGSNVTHITHIYAGIAGAGSEENRKLLKETILPHVPTGAAIRVEPDSVNALYSGTYGEAGIVQISGTGSITYGINNNMKHDRVGGWGYLLGDEGSGYDIGRQGIAQVLKAYDGRGPDTIMSQLVFSYFAVNDAQALIRKIYGSQSPKNEISALSKIVIQAYLNQDEVAKRIIGNVVRELNHHIETLHRKLFPKNDKVKVVLCGGLFSEKSISELVKESLHNTPELDVILPKLPPVGGSVIGAYLMNGQKPTNDIIQNLIHTI